MLRFHTLVLTSDNSIKQSLRRLGVAISSTVEFLDSLPEPPETVSAAAAHLLVIDMRDARWGRPGADGAIPPALSAFKDLPASARQILLVEDDQLVERLDLLRHDPTASVICVRGPLDDDELIATATKLLRTELFGLQKYLPWGVTTFTIDVRSYDEKDQALRVLTEFAALAGWRGPLRERIELVCDELMMNALYHAPVDAAGRRRNEGKTIRDLVGMKLGPIQIQYGSSGRYFGISVRDGFGSLTRKGLLDHLDRARTVPAKIEDKASGAGLGLVMVLRSVSKLVVNLTPRSTTEVIALFDRDLLSRGQAGARSLHLFVGPSLARMSDVSGEVARSGEASATTLQPAGPGPGPGMDSQVSAELRGPAPLPYDADIATGALIGGRRPQWLVPVLLMVALLSGLIVYQTMGRHAGGDVSGRAHSR